MSQVSHLLLALCALLLCASFISSKSFLDDFALEEVDDQGSSTKKIPVANGGSFTLAFDDNEPLHFSEDSASTLSFNAAKQVPSFSFDDQPQKTGLDYSAHTHTLLVNGYEDISTLSHEEEEYALSVALGHFSEEEADDQEEENEENEILFAWSKAATLDADEPLRFERKAPVDKAYTLSFADEENQPINFDSQDEDSAEILDFFSIGKRSQNVNTLDDDDHLDFEDSASTLSFGDENNHLQFEKAYTLNSLNDANRQFGVEQPEEAQELFLDSLKNWWGTKGTAVVDKIKQEADAMRKANQAPPAPVALEVDGELHFSSNEAEVLDFDDDETVTEYFGN